MSHLAYGHVVMSFWDLVCCTMWVATRIDVQLHILLHNACTVTVHCTRPLQSMSPDRVSVACSTCVFLEE